MENWEALVFRYPSMNDLRTFTNTLRKAEPMLKEDLAPFEIDCFINSLLYKPVELLTTISSQRAVETWGKLLEDAFKLLTDIVTKFGDSVEQYYEDIVQVCNLKYSSAKTANQALSCLAQVARRSALGATDAERYIEQLLVSKNSKTQLALLIGTICECHPDKVANDIETILRTFLSSNVLYGDRNTDLVMCSALQGLAGLLKNFGDELPTSDLIPLYDKLTKELILRPKCDKVVLDILSAYAPLFAERLLADAALRRALWRQLAAGNDAAIAAALRAIYDALLHMAGQTNKRVQQIIDEEVTPRLNSYRLSKYTALRVLALAKEQYEIRATVDATSDVHELEFELRHGQVAYSVADEVAWCLESKVTNSERLLQTAIMFFTNLPKTKLKQTVVHNLFAAPDGVRQSCVIFLTTESCQDAASLERFRPLWTLIFSSDDGGDDKFLEGARLVFEDFMEYMVMLLEMFLDEQHEVFPEKLCWLLYLCVWVVGGVEAVEAGAEWCARALRQVCGAARACGPAPALLAAGAALAHALAPLHRHIQMQFYHLLDVDTCLDEEVLNETCLALVHAPDGLGRIDTVLDALQITLSSRDTAPDVLCAALRKLDELLSRNDLDSSQTDQLLYQVEKLRTRKRANTKNDRILMRDVLLFLGKFGESGRSGPADLLAGGHEPIILSVQNPSEYGVSYNIDLREMLQLAEAEEDVDALRSILAVVCASRSWCPRVLCARGARGARGLRACAALSRAPAEPAAALAHVLPHITPERRWSIRRLLAEGVGSQLSGAGDDALAAAINRALLLTNSTLQTAKRAGLDLIESLMVPLNDRNDLSKSLLPQILIDTAKAFEINSCSAFNAASEVFIEKIPILDENVLQNLQKDLILTIISDKMEVITDDMIIYKLTVKNILELFKRMDVEEVDCASKMTIKRLYVAVQARKLGVECLVKSLAAPAEMRQALGVVVDADDWFQVETFLIFLEQFADVLQEDNADRVIQVIADIISRLDAETIKLVQKSLKSCVRVYLSRSSEQQHLNSKVNEYCSRAPLQEITKDLKQNIFNPGHIDQIIALNVITDLGCSLDETNKSVISQWPRLLFKMWTQDMHYPSDLLKVAVRSLTQTELKNLIINGQGIVPEGSEEIVKFCRMNMCVFFVYLARKPFLLGDSDVAKCGVLLNDVVQWYVRRKCPLEWSNAVLDLVDQLWPSYEGQVPFDRKVALLQDMRRLPTVLPPDSAPMRWAVERMTQGGVAEMISLVAVLPPGEAYKGSFWALAGLLPTRLRELSGESNAVFRALVDAAADGDHTLLEIIAKLASGDDTAGWWDEALDCCMASLAQRVDRGVCDLLQQLAWNGDSLGVCDRLYLPLLRHSSSQFLEEYLPEEVVKALKFPERAIKPASVFAYREQVKRYAVVFSTIQLSMEKLSTPTLELGSSSLNSRLGAPQPWHAVREVLRKSVDYMQRTICPDGADKPLQHVCRQAQGAAFACACAALRRRAPAERAYGALFEPALWPALVDPHVTHDLPLPSHHVVRKVRHTVGIEDADAAGVTGTARTARTTGATGTLTSSTHRSRLFLRTLSQNPLEYDREPTPDEAPGELEVEVRASWLNSLRVSRDVSALLRHAAARRLAAPRRLAAALRSDMHHNAKLMLAQVVCNCSAELAQYADELRPALFQLIADAEDEPFNSLHLDILTTLSQWRDNISLPDNAHLNTAVVRLMLAIINNRHQKYTQDILIECMNKLLEVYGPMVSVEWKLFERYFHDKDDVMHKTCLRMMQTFTKNKVYITGMVQAIIKILNEQGGLSADMTKFLGKALSVRCDEDTLMEDALKKASHLDFIKMLYYAQMECGRCCTFKLFEKVIKLYSTMPTPEKKKCLRIMASFLSGPYSRNSGSDVLKKLHLQEYIKNTDDDDIIAEAIKVVKCSLHLMGEPLKSALVQLVAEHCRHLSANVREAALDVVTKALPEWRPSEGSAVLEARREARGEAGGGACGVRALCAAGRSLPRRAAAALAAHLPTRFAESLYLAVYLPATADENLDLCEVASTFLETLFSGMRSHEAFKNFKLRNEPLQNNEPTRTLTLTSCTRHFTLGNGTMQAADPDVPAVDVQMKVDDILANLFQFARTNEAAAVRLVSAATRACAAGAGADAARASSCLGELLAELLAAAPRSLLPLLLQLARDFLPHLCERDSFRESVATLRRELIGTESEDLAVLLHEEMLLKTRGPELFVLGSKQEEMDVDMVNQDEQFSIRDLVSSFGKLSNWDNLTLQEKRRIQGGLPPLWTDEQTFNSALKEYHADGDSWFGKMLSACRGSDELRSMHWLRELQREPKRQFEVSAMTEAIQWQSSDSLSSLYRGERDLPRNECLAEWAARLMLRTWWVSQQRGALRARSRALELRWCARAAAARLAAPALLCTARNGPNLNELDTLPWFLQRLLALRTQALDQHNTTQLAKILEQAVTYVPKFPRSEPAVLLHLNQLTLQLRRDINKISERIVDEALEKMNEQCSRIEDLCSRSKKIVHDTLRLAMTCYLELWTENNDAECHNSLLRGMSRVVRRAAQEGAGAGLGALLAALLRRDRACDHTHDVLDELLDTVERVLPRLAPAATSAALRWATRAPHAALHRHAALAARLAGRGLMFRRCLQLLCDPHHTLASYCRELADALLLNDPALWDKTFTIMSEKLFENEYLGSDFRLLVTYKKPLYEIKHYDATDSNKKLKTLKELEEKLQRPPQKTLRLSQLCRVLASEEVRNDPDLAELLDLPKGLSVVSFDEQVLVMTQSVRRPCVVSAALSDGSRRRFLHKRGDRPRLDAAVLHAAETLLPNLTTYMVKPLSEDCALIEYLEDHIQLDTLIAESCDLSQMSVPRDDSELVLRAAAAALLAFRTRCDAAPAHALRTSLEKRSSSLEDFVRKKTRFLETVASTTLLCWLFGVGDRHTQNMLVGADGGVACVDWADALRHGAAELPPARLTRNVLAVLDTNVLESRLQQHLSELRESATINHEVIKFAFSWTGEKIIEKLKYVEGFLNGKYLPHHVTKMALRDEGGKHFEKYIELLDQVFEDYKDRQDEQYSVEEQVSCLLRQCTDPRILSVTRYGWQPWL